MDYHATDIVLRDNMLYKLSVALYNEGEEPDVFPQYPFYADNDEIALELAKKDLYRIGYEHKMQLHSYAVCRLIPGNSPRECKTETVKRFIKIGVNQDGSEIMTEMRF